MGKKKNKFGADGAQTPGHLQELEEYMEGYDQLFQWVKRSMGGSDDWICGQVDRWIAQGLILGYTLEDLLSLLRTRDRIQHFVYLHKGRFDQASFEALLGRVLEFYAAETRYKGGDFPPYAVGPYSIWNKSPKQN